MINSFSLYLIAEFYKEATRSRHSSFAFIPPLNKHLANPAVLKRIVKNRDKGKRF